MPVAFTLLLHFSFRVSNGNFFHSARVNRLSGFSGASPLRLDRVPLLLLLLLFDLDLVDMMENREKYCGDNLGILQRYVDLIDDL